MKMNLDNYYDIYGPNHWYDSDISKLGKIESGPEGYTFFSPALNMNYTCNELLQIARLLSDINVSKQQ